MSKVNKICLADKTLEQTAEEAGEKMEISVSDNDRKNEKKTEVSGNENRECVVEDATKQLEEYWEIVLKPFSSKSQTVFIAKIDQVRAYRSLTTSFNYCGGFRCRDHINLWACMEKISLG